VPAGGWPRPGSPSVNAGTGNTAHRPRRGKAKSQVKGACATVGWLARVSQRVWLASQKPGRRRLDCRPGRAKSVKTEGHPDDAFGRSQSLRGPLDEGMKENVRR